MVRSLMSHREMSQLKSASENHYKILNLEHLFPRRVDKKHRIVIDENHFDVLDNSFLPTYSGVGAHDKHSKMWGVTHQTEYSSFQIFLMSRDVYEVNNL